MFRQLIKNYLLNFLDFPKECRFSVLLTIFNSMTIGICLFLPVYLFSNLHFSIASSGAVISCEGVGSVVGGYLGGKLCDRYSEKFLAIFFLILQALAFFTLSQATTFNAIALALFILGLSLYGFRTANSVIMLLFCGHDEVLRVKTLNITHVASNLGFGITGMIIGLISESHFSWVFYMAAGILIYSALLLCFKSISQPVHTTAKTKPQPATERFDQVDKSNSFLLAFIVLSVLFISIGFSQLSSTYPIYIKESFPGIGNKFVGLLFFINTMMILLLQSSLPKLYANKNIMLVMGLGAFFAGLGTFILIFQSYKLLAVLACICWTAGEMLFVPTAQSLCYEVSPNKKKGSSVGLYQSLFALSMMLGPVMGGFIYGQLSPQWLWSLVSISSFLVFFGSIVWMNARQLISEKC